MFKTAGNFGFIILRSMRRVQKENRTLKNNHLLVSDFPLIILIAKKAQPQDHLDCTHPIEAKQPKPKHDS
jgi:hypothetical protein